MFYSIIMPCYNAQDTIEKSVLSVMNQTFKDLELIVVDDGSTDRSIDVVRDLMRSHGNIRLFTQKHSGPGAARNLGIRNAKGEYIAFLDSDDYWDSDFLELVDGKSQSLQPDVIFYDLTLEDSFGRVLGYRKSSVFSSKGIPELVRLQMVGTLMWGMTKVIKKSIITTNACLFTADSVGEEAVFSFKVLSKSKSVSFVNRPIYHYVSNKNGQHLSGGLNPWGPIVSRMKNYLIENECYGQYERTVNSFGLKSLLIYLYRLSKSNRKSKDIKDAILEFKKEHDIDYLDWPVLDKKTKFLSFLVRFNFVHLIMAFSKLRG